MPNYFPKKIAHQSIVLYLLIFVLVNISFPEWFLGIHWFLFGFASVLFFFLSANKISLKWRNISSLSFEKKVFIFALSIRVIYVLFSYFYYLEMTGEPFEFEGLDAKGYHNEALWMVELFNSGNFNKYFTEYLKGFSDSGYPIFLFPFNLFFGETLLIPRFANAILGAWMVVLVYKLASRNFGDKVGRLAAIFVALLPNLIYYTGLHMKEILMSFLLIAFIERADCLLRSKRINFRLVIFVFLIGMALFFFRTVLALAAFFSLFFAFLYSKRKLLGLQRKIVYVFFFSMAGLIIIVNNFSNEVEGYYKQRTTNQQDQMLNYTQREGGNKLAKYGTSAIFIPVILIVPFPTLINTNQLNSQMLNGAYFTRNIYAFFVMLSIILLWKRKIMRNHILILSIIFTYLAILSVSAFAFSERFHLPVLPFLLILFAYGIVNWRVSYQKYFNIYSFLIIILIFAWNWFKIAGRT